MVKICSKTRLHMVSLIRIRKSSTRNVVAISYISPPATIQVDVELSLCNRCNQSNEINLQYYRLKDCIENDRSK